MAKTSRINLSLFDTELKALINASMKVFPMTQEDIDNDVNPNNYEYGRVGNSIYRWDNGVWKYIIADDTNITWDEIKLKPLEFTPKAHTHSEADISDLDKYTKQETNALLEDKANTDHVHDYAPSVHDHDDVYAVKATEGVVEDHETRLFNIENGYTEGHTHPNVSILNSITQLMVDAWNTVTGKAEKSYVDTELGKRVLSTTFQGHVDSTAKHPTKVSQLTNDSGYITAEQVPPPAPSYKVGTVKPTDKSLWIDTN